MNVQENVELAPLTTFKIGGSSRYFIDVQHIDDLGAALDYAQTRNVPYFILAGGSNTLVSDTGFEGVVIKISFSKRAIDTENKEITAEAGCSLMATIHGAASAGLSGMESMYGIPGSVGGAVRGNAGAFGTEVKDVLKSAIALNIETREMRTFSNKECRFSYRSSFFKRNPDWIILSATFTLQMEKEDGTALARASETLSMRNERQIQDIQSAGSFFLNPIVHKGLRTMFEDEKGVPARENRVPAGWLIEKAGFKGVCMSGACTGARSSNYVINDDTATAESVRALVARITDKVISDFGVELHPEVTQVGFSA
ncbi:UDP-N-acetylenolpyruvoylglucosamine reductase [bacterium]|nr:UDP-N-acetylenolpyruvoylglucosamine reductase [bacterium]|tara:strand:- start:6451 stop:7389 length:939 start_codon:yes stop_codon:yes gene_type:complete